jgi:putative acetyltransferase
MSIQSTSCNDGGAVVIREYAPEDKDAVLDVWYESAQVAYPFWEPQTFDQERQAIAEQHLPHATTYVYERAGTVVGFVSLLGTEVGGLFVTPLCHRKGIGRALMDHARATRDHLEVEVFHSNVIARAFYDRYGFRVIGERVDEAMGIHVLRLELRPKPATRRER